MTFGLAAYRIGTRLVAPVLPLWLQRRTRAGKEDPARLGERLGNSDTARPDGPLLWLHGASLGESQVLRELIPLIRERVDAHILVTTQTLSSAEVWAAELPTRTIHQFAPLDTPQAARRFLDHWRPNAAVFVESEIWPNLLRGLQLRDIPAALVNARMNADSLNRWATHPRTARKVFGAFDTLAAVDARTSEGLEAVLSRGVPVLSNLKLAAAPAPDAAQVSALRDAFGTGPIVCLASLHAEEAHLVDALPGVARIIVPRHPDRFAPDSALRDAPRRSTGALPSPGPTPYLFDTFGEMAVAMAAADVVVMGGSFASTLKGHNPVEALRLHKPVVSGRYVASFHELYTAYWNMTGTQPASVKTLADAVAAAKWTPDHDRYVNTFGDPRAEVADALAGLLHKAFG